MRHLQVFISGQIKMKNNGNTSSINYDGKRQKGGIFYLESIYHFREMLSEN